MRKMLSWILGSAISLLCLELAGCAGFRIHIVEVKQVGPAQAASLVSEGGAFVVDVSYPEDYAREHIPGAVSIPKSQVWYRMPDLPSDLNALILIYDTRGRRSSDAALRLKDEGYNKVYELIGGVEAWKEAGLPLAGEAFNSG